MATRGWNFRGIRPLPLAPTRAEWYRPRHWSCVWFCQISVQCIEQGATQMIIGILITFLVIILVLYLVNMLPLDGRTKHIVRVIVIVIGIISLLKYLAVF
jgi:hypothetical protein